MVGDAPIDACIMGGGPAGATAARLLSSWGHSVVLLTRPSPHGTLGESIPPSSSKLFERIGIAAAVESANFIRSTGNTAWWGTDARVESFTGGARGYQVQRADFDELLLRLAEGAGVHTQRDARVLGVDIAPTGSSVSYATGSGRDSIAARWVLDASGRSGVIARQRWRRAQAGARTLALVALWDRPGGWPLQDETHTVVESYQSGWAWSVPVSPTRRCIAVMVDPALTEIGGRDGLHGRYDSELSQAPRLHELIRGAHVVRAPWACEASAYDAERVSDEGVLLVGDAASFVDPLSSFGVKKALASAWLAAVVVHTSLVQPELQTAALQLYEARERHIFESLQRASAALAQSAAVRHGHAFWFERAEADARDLDGEPDIDALRSDADVLGAFESLKQRPSLDLRTTSQVQRIERPIVQANRVALVTHLSAPAFPSGIRFVRDVDLVTLSDLAGKFHEVPELFEAYQRAAPPVALPDFLGALSVLIGKGLLEYA